MSNVDNGFDIFNLEGNKVSKNLKDYDTMIYGASKLRQDNICL